jgi:(1->4)-alpha-D-glucan 1-alpha-D-glucosylmutase
VRELRATYRLQLTPQLDFAAALELVPYLRALGISHLYLSPSLQARRGSTHGYDVVDPARVSDALGGEDGLRALADTGLGVILDIVPNHMGIGEENRWWTDPVLREQFFDIDPVTGRHRRFFDIDDLAALRQEDPEVFQATHAKVLALLADGVLDGLRVDHPDGLADPAGYLARLREGGAGRVWVEKILHPDEPLRDWPVSGTVGYEFLVDVQGLFVDPAGEPALTTIWQEISGDERDFAAVALQAQLEQASSVFASELERLERVDPRFTVAELGQAAALLPVYRTYVEPWSGRVQQADIDALTAVQAQAPELARVLALEDPPTPPELITRFQQTTPAITAKGIEDTAFYRHLRLLALNEVGGDPGRFSVGVAAMHAANVARSPDGLLTTQTHDTKRSGDARARIGALSTLAPEWAAQVREWRARFAPSPDPIAEYLIYQTLIGVWPIERERLDAYLLKALREAKRRTNWISPDEAYEGEVLAFARRVCTDEAFVASFEAFLERVRPEGERSALCQLLIKLTAPGVPDIYYGDELWRLSLVDPDNRRPVDFGARRTALQALRGGEAPTATTAKLYLIWRALELRARRPAAFAGAYEAVPVDGGEALAYLRGEREVLVVAPVRHYAHAHLNGVAGGWRDVLGGGAPTDLERAQPLAPLIAERGFALLERA